MLITNPAPEFELEPHECFELLRPLYGLCDAGDLWHETLHKNLTNDLGLTPTKVELSLYFSFRLGKLVWLNGIHVDDLLRAGPDEFRDEARKTHQH